MAHIPGVNSRRIEQVVTAVVTLAQINAGFTLIAPVAGTQIEITRFNMLVTGTFATLTDVRLSDIDLNGATANDVLTVAVANLGTGVRHSDTTGTNTLGAAFWAPLSANNGLQIRKTGSTGTGGTSITIKVGYVSVVSQ